MGSPATVHPTHSYSTTWDPVPLSDSKSPEHRQNKNLLAEIFVPIAGRLELKPCRVMPYLTE